MGCPTCRTVVRTADAVNVAALISQAQLDQGGRAGALKFCADCRSGTKAADAPTGLTPAELAEDFGADSPASADVDYLLIFNPADGSISFSLAQGALRATGTIAANATDQDTAMAQVLAAATAAGLTLPVGFQVPMPSAVQPSISGSASPVPGKAAGGLRGALKRTEQQHRRLLYIMAGVGLVVVLGVVLFYGAKPHRKE